MHCKPSKSPKRLAAYELGGLARRGGDGGDVALDGLLDVGK